MEQALFLAPALGIIYLMTSKHLKRKLALLLPVALSSGFLLWSMVHQPRNAAVPQNLPAEVVLERISMFSGYLSPFIDRNSPLLVLLLPAAGLAGVLFYPGIRDRFLEASHFSWLPERLRILALPVFVFAWTFFTAVPFIAFNQHMDVRTIHLSGYGPWLLMAPGLFLLISIGLFFLGKAVRDRLFVFVVFLVILTAGTGHYRHAANRYARASYDWDSISSSVSHFSFPHGSRIVITDAYMGSYSSYNICTGYLCRLLNNRLDVGGLVGKEYFYYDPFSREKLWETRMTGLQGTGNLHLFRFVPNREAGSGGALIPYRYFLRVVPGTDDRGEGEQDGYWRLYEIEESGNAAARSEGWGLDAYLEFLKEMEEKGIGPEDICWGNPSDPFGGNSPLRE